MPPDRGAQFDLALAFGSARERVVLAYLKARGVTGFSMAQFEGADHAPIVEVSGGQGRVAAPDRILWSEGKNYFGEVKAKNQWVRGHREQIETGFDESSFRAYTKLHDQIGTEIWLFFVHELEEPTGLYSGALSTLRQPANHRVWDGRRRDGSIIRRPHGEIQRAEVLFPITALRRVCSLDLLPGYSSAIGKVRTTRALTWRIDGVPVETPAGELLSCHAPTSEERKRQPRCVVVTILDGRRWIPAEDLEPVNEVGRKAIEAALAASPEESSKRHDTDTAAVRFATDLLELYEDAAPPADEWALAAIYRHDVTLAGDVLYAGRVRPAPLATLAALTLWLRARSAAALEWTRAQHERLEPAVQRSAAVVDRMAVAEPIDPRFVRPSIAEAAE